MENFEELSKVQYDNVAGLYINNPNRMSYLLFTANKNQEQQEIQEINPEVTRYLHLMSSLVSDYTKGIYRKIPFRTILSTISTLAYFVTPNKSVIDRVPGVGLIKKVSLITLMIKSIKNDLLKYEKWKKAQGEFVEV